MMKLNFHRVELIFIRIWIYRKYLILLDILISELSLLNKGNV